MPFARSRGELQVDGVPLARIADAVGTPAYVYSWPSVRARYAELESALDGIGQRICYSVKANGNLALLARLAKLGGRLRHRLRRRVGASPARRR